MSAEIVQFTSGALAVAADQTTWTDQQIAVLHGLGIDEEKVTQAEMDVFLHECQRTALDPFTKQIYLIGRYDSRAGREVFRSQTGIDGYRVVAHRAARRDRVELSYSDTLWCGPDGVWREVWLDRDQPPLAAKVTVCRNDKPFPAIATLAEYAATYKNGDPTPMWRRMPSTMLAKCAEALALRKAFPQDLAGIYTAEEMEQADNQTRQAPTVQTVPQQRQAQRVTARPAEPDPWETPAPAQSAPVAAPPPAAEPEYAEVVGEQAPVAAMLPPFLVEGLRVVRGAESSTAVERALSQILGRSVAIGDRLSEADLDKVAATLQEEDRQHAKQRQQDEREAARAAEAAAAAVADKQEVDWILGGLTAVRGITDPQSKRVAIEYMVGVEMPDPYRMTVEQAASVRAVLESEYVAAQQDDPAPATKATQKRRNAMHAAFNGMGITDHTERIAYAGLVVGHAVTSTNELSAAEVEQVIEALNAGRTIDSFPISERAAQLKSMVWSAVSSDNLAEVSERFWQAHEGGEISDVERDVLISASGRREQQLAQMARAAA